MLAQSFKTAEELQITEAQKDALIKTLVLLETGKLQHVPEISPKFVTDEKSFTGHFNMEWWHGVHPCGTVACIGGTAELVGNVIFGNYVKNRGLYALFEPMSVDDWREITTKQAATALRSYLTTGDARWDLAVS